MPSPPSPSWCSQWETICASLVFGRSASKCLTPLKWVSGAPGTTCDHTGVLGILIGTKLREQTDAKPVELQQVPTYTSRLRMHKWLNFTSSKFIYIWYGHIKGRLYTRLWDGPSTFGFMFFKPSIRPHFMEYIRAQASCDM